MVHSNTVERDASTSESARLQRSYRARSTHQLSTPQCARDSTRAPGGLHRPCTVLPCLQLLAASVSRCRCMEAVYRPQSARPQAAEAVLDAPQRVGPGPTRWRRVRCVRADNSADTMVHDGTPDPASHSPVCCLPRAPGDRAGLCWLGNPRDLLQRLPTCPERVPAAFDQIPDADQPLPLAAPRLQATGRPPWT